MTGMGPIQPGSLADLMGRAAEVRTGGADARPGEVQDAGSAFGSSLERALGALNESQLRGDAAARDVAAGRTDDLAGALVKIEEAEITLQMATSIRNKAIEAYQEIMRMQI